MRVPQKCGDLQGECAVELEAGEYALLVEGGDQAVATTGAFDVSMQCGGRIGGRMVEVKDYTAPVQYDTCYRSAPDYNGYVTSAFLFRMLEYSTQIHDRGLCLLEPPSNRTKFNSIELHWVGGTCDGASDKTRFQATVRATVIDDNNECERMSGTELFQNINVNGTSGEYDIKIGCVDSTCTTNCTVNQANVLDRALCLDRKYKVYDTSHFNTCELRPAPTTPLPTQTQPTRAPTTSSPTQHRELEPMSQEALRNISRDSGAGRGLNHRRCEGWDGQDPCASDCLTCGMLRGGCRLDGWHNCPTVRSDTSPTHHGSGLGTGHTASPTAAPTWTVIGILLQATQMTGRIPEAICRLTWLNQLFLPVNHLSGPIPDCICELRWLSDLSLFVNQLSGTVMDCIGGLTRLGILDLNSNQLTGPIPGRIFETNLDTLDLSSNHFNGSIPAHICARTGLHRVKLSSNQLTGPIPTCICELTNLETLVLSSNQLTGPALLPCMGTMHRVLDNGRSALIILSLSSNRFSGPLMPTTNITTRFAGPTFCGGALPGTLQELRLDDNPGFDPGPVPDCLCQSPPGQRYKYGNSTQLQYIALSNTRRTGEIPPCLGTHLPHLSNLTLDDNPGLVGPAIPATFCRLQLLRGLYLQDNPGLFGAIPACVYNMTGLAELNLLNVPGLRGPLPPGLFALYSLQYLMVSGARFDQDGGGNGGMLPQQHTFECPAGHQTGSGATGAGAGGALCPWYYPYYPYNKIASQSKPTTNGSSLPWLPNAKLVAMVDCGLTGPIPSFMLNLPKATAIVLSGNQLSGPIPTAAPNSPARHQLTQLVAADNLITGTLEPIQGFTALYRLDLSHNKIGGSVEDWLPKSIHTAAATATTGCFEAHIPDHSVVCWKAYELFGFTCVGDYCAIRLWLAWRVSCAVDVDSNAHAADCSACAMHYPDRMLDTRTARCILPPAPAAIGNNRTLLRLQDNYMSCALPDMDTITVGGGGTLELLANNEFSCPLSESVKHSDPDGSTYKCGSASFDSSVYRFAVLGVLGLVLSWLGHRKIYASTAANSSAMAAVAPPSRRTSASALFAAFSSGGDSDGGDTTDSMLLRAGAASTALFVVVLVPTYVATPAVVTCRHWWKVTAAYMPTQSAEIQASWLVVVAVVCGVGATAVIIGMILVPTLRLHAAAKTGVASQRIGMPSRPRLCLRWGLGWAKAWLISLLWMVSHTLLNVGFIYIEEDPALFSESVKSWLVVVFGLVHETVDHLVAPWVVWLIIGFIPAAHLTLETVHTWIVGLELLTSVVGPLVAFVFTSEGCLRNYVLPVDVLPTTTAVDRVYCTYSLLSDGNENQSCETFHTVVATVSYTTPFEFSGERCVSSVITLYTPAFLSVFALRIALLYPLWWIQKNRPGWVTPGLHHLHQLYENADDVYMHKLHALRKRIEDNTFGINTLTIGLCGGIASPAIAVAALLCQAIKHAMYSWLDSAHTVARATTDDVPMLILDAGVYEDELGGALAGGDGDDAPLVHIVGSSVHSPPQMHRPFALALSSLDAGDDTAAEATGTNQGGLALYDNGDEHDAPFHLPIGSIALVLAVTMLYVAMFIAANGLPWLAIAISLLSGVGFGAACRWIR